MERAGAGGQVVQAGEPRSARLESLRAVAALAVLASHTFAYAHGWRPVIFRGFVHRAVMGGGFGVQLFFALSGFLLYRAFARRDFADGAAVDLRTYARNRAIRILPLYYVAVVTLLVLSPHGGSAEQWWRFLTFSQEFSTRTAQTVDGPMWSLVVELHFYLLLPALAWAIDRLARRSVARAAWMLLALGGASVALHEAALQPAVIWTYSLPVTFYGFVPGMLLAVLQTGWRRGRPGWLRGLGARSDVWVLASAALWLIIFWRYSLVTLTAPASFLLLGACVLPLEPGKLTRPLDWRPLALIGVASYSLYIWHVPIIEHLVPHARHGTLGLLALALPSSLIVAAASYAAIERPALRHRRRWAQDGPAATAIPPRPRAAGASPDRRPAWCGLLGGALLLRVAAVLSSRPLRLGGDAVDYDRLGRLLASGHGFGHSVLAAAGGPTTFRAPLYPLFLGGIYRVSGDSITAARLLQAALGVAVVALAGVIVQRFWGQRVALIAAGLAAAFPPLIVASTALMSESIYLPLELGAVVAALQVHGRGRHRWEWLVLSGALAGLGVLARPNGAVLIPALMALVAAGGRARSGLSAAPRGGRAAVASLVIAAAAGLVVAPWLARDAVTFHRLVPITDIDGFNLAGTYNRQAAHDPYPTRYQWRPPTGVPELLPLFRDRSLNEVALGDALRRRGIDYLVAHPSALAAATFWNSWRMAELTGIGPGAVEVREEGFGQSMAVLGAVSLWLVAALAAYGLARGSLRRAPPALWLAPALLWAVTAPVLGTARLRAPIDPFLVMAAAVGASGIADRWRGGRDEPPLAVSNAARDVEGRVASGAAPTLRS